MKSLCFVLAAAALSAPALAGTDVGVSIGISQPGFYGRIDIGSVGAPPVLVYPQPVIIARPAAVVVQRPIYLHVPPGHAKHWHKHCAPLRRLRPAGVLRAGRLVPEHYAGPPGQGKGKGKGHHKHG